MLQLQNPTSPVWTEHVIANFNEFLFDHAACERKASSMAISMLVHYPDRQELVAAMTDLAVEELNHFKQVMQIILDKNLQLPADQKDPYITQLRGHLRNGSDVYFLDRLILAGVIEARGCERFGLVAEALPDGKLKTFYQAITNSESRHKDLFIELACCYFPEHSVKERLNQWLLIEAEIVEKLPLRAALH